MRQIFINYRRDDSSGYVGRLHEHLSNHFGAGQVFLDIDTIAPGAAIPETIKQALDECKVLIAVIGSKWLSIVEPNTERRRIDT